MENKDKKLDRPEMERILGEKTLYDMINDLKDLEVKGKDLLKKSLETDTDIRENNAKVNELKLKINQYFKDNLGIDITVKGW